MDNSIKKKGKKIFFSKYKQRIWWGFLNGKIILISQKCSF